ncbi:TPA: hypothetical protein U2B37_000415 [Streptococcus suis]|nr:hypothetical protein [Streptococcus sp.]HEM5988347.1 hypothetical protein [Streptococcus suis]
MCEKIINTLYKILFYILVYSGSLIFGAISVLWLNSDSNQALISAVFVLLLDQEMFKLLFNIERINNFDEETLNSRIALVKWVYALLVLYGLIISKFFPNLINIYKLNIDFPNEINKIAIVLVGPIFFTVFLVFAMLLISKSRINNKQKIINVFLFASNSSNNLNILPGAISKITTTECLKSLQTTITSLRENKYFLEFSEADLEFYKNLNNEYLVKLSTKEALRMTDDESELDFVESSYLFKITFDNDRIKSITMLNT